MENLKIRVNSEAESREVQELFFELGYTWSGDSKDIFDFDMPEYIVNWNNGYITVGDNFDKNRQEITLPELRDLVVLKRNDATDCTHWHVTGQANLPYLFAMDEWYFFGRNGWEKSTHTHEFYNRLIPIKKPMKEYLFKYNDQYTLVELSKEDAGSNPEQYIEVPEGCNIITCENRKGNLVYFHWKYLDSDEFFLKDEKIWSNNFNETLSDFIEKNEGDVVIIWSRYTHPEELPFIDDEPSINDQYAEIEKVRQTLKTRQRQYGSFEDVAMFTEQMVDVMRKGYYEKLAYNQKMALYMICSKMARIVNGNPNHKDSWHDIAGYATLIDNELVSEKDMPF